MTCLECEKELGYMDHRKSMELFQAELCPYHRKRLERLLARTKLPVEAIILYYGLRQEGIRPMLAWWDGKKTVDLAISRVRLNIEVDRGYESLSYQQAMQELESNLCAFRDGFTHIRIPHHLIRNHTGETVSVILRVMESLREKTRVV
jgi:very-short-patch-repair endonuclease